MVIGPEAPLVAGLADDLEPQASKCSARRRRQPSSKAPKASPRISAPKHRHPDRRAIGASPMPRRRWPMSGEPQAGHRDQGRRARRRQGRDHRRRRASEASQAIDAFFLGAFGDGGHGDGDRGIPRGRGGELLRPGGRDDRSAARHRAGPQARLRRRQGPNTGGMGAYSPAPIMTPELIARTMDEIVLPTVPPCARAGRRSRACSMPG